jgi:hypothetical protein
MRGDKRTTSGGAGAISLAVNQNSCYVQFPKDQEESGGRRADRKRGEAGAARRAVQLRAVQLEEKTYYFVLLFNSGNGLIARSPGDSAATY